MPFSPFVCLFIFLTVSSRFFSLFFPKKKKYKTKKPDKLNQ
jgi:hypothetical protein